MFKVVPTMKAIVERVIWNDAKTIQILSNQGFDGSDIHDIIFVWKYG